MKSKTKIKSLIVSVILISFFCFEVTSILSDNNKFMSTTVESTPPSFSVLSQGENLHWHDSFEDGTGQQVEITNTGNWSDGGSGTGWYFGQNYTNSATTGCANSATNAQGAELDGAEGSWIAFTESSSGYAPSNYILESDAFTLYPGDNLSIDFFYHCNTFI